MLTNIIDAYERPARLYPALISLIPVLSIVIGVYGVELRINAAFVGLITAFGGLFLLMQISRNLGKRLEQSLYSSWGGIPTTQLLRHRDNSLSFVTKKSYHDFLGRHINSKFPTIEEEAIDPIAADAIYQAGIKWLIGKTRDKSKFTLIFKENVAYGFQRNSLGLKPIGIIIAVFSIIWIVASCGVIRVTGVSMQNLIDSNIGVKVSLIVSLGMLLIWMFLITRHSVRRIAFSYADMLLQACDKLPKKR